MNNIDLQFVVKEETPIDLFNHYFKQTPLGLVPLQDDIPVKAFELAGLVLLEQLDRLRLAIGDWAVLLSTYHGAEAYERIAAGLLSERMARTVEDWAYICRNVPIREPELTMSHYRKVAPLPIPEQGDWLRRAVAGSWSVRRLGDEIARAGNQPPPPRIEDKLFEFEQENARLHRRIDNLIQERDTTISNIRGTLKRLISLGPEGLVREPGKALEAIRGILRRLEEL